MSDGSQVVVRCVRASNDTNVIQEAYEVIKEIGADSVWFTEDECLTVQTKESRFIYLFERFSGPAFQHICSTGNRIYGPVCVLHCMKKSKALPKEKHPVYNMAMTGMRVSCTSVAKDQRDVIHQHVEWMSGQICKDFHQDVTHLVAGEVGSKKYLVAAKLHKKVMSPEWVERVWDASQSSFIRGDDPTFDQFRCPIFKGYVVTVSGLDSNERAQIKEIIHKEGGRYSGEMKKEECTHLVINVPRGQKYEVAMQWGIHVVTSQWLFESLEAGYCLEEANFPVRATDEAAQDRKNHATSTPTRNRQSTCNMSDMPDVSVISMTHVNDTNMTMMQNSTMASVRNQTISQVNKTVVSGNQTLTTNDQTQDVLVDLDLTTAGSEMFLDGCKIFLSGFKGAQLEKLRKVINLGGGTRFNQINESVSHVVIGERVDSHIEQLQMATFRPHVVSVEWLVSCVQSGECVDENPYICLNLAPLEPTTPKPKSRKSSLNASKISSRKSGSVSDSTLTKAVPERTAPSTPQPPQDKEDMNDLLSQYLPEDTSKDTMGESTLMRAAEMGEVANQQATSVSPANQKTTPSTPANQQAGQSTPPNDYQEADPKQAQGDMDVTVDPNATTGPENGTDGSSTLFQGVTFVFQGFEQIAVQEMTPFIKQSGGRVLQSNTRRVPDYAIVPLFGYPVDITVGDIVTNAWLQICLEQCQVLPVHADPIYTPLDLAPGDPPLTSCVLSVSGYKGTERDCIIHMAQIMGATVQDYFVKRANVAKQLKESTHLVVDVAEGSKYTAAIKWKLPAVTKNWLIECARLNEQVEEDAFLVDRASPPSTEPVAGKCENIPQNHGQGHSSHDEGHSSKHHSRTNHAEETSIHAKSRKSKSEDVPMETETDTAADDVSRSERTLQQQRENIENMAEQEVEYRESQKENRRQSSVSGGSNGNNASVAKAGNGSNTKPRKDTLEQKPYLLNTPKLVNQRVKALVEENRTETPKAHKSGNMSWLGVDSPSKFLDPNVSFHANFDLSEAMAALQSPAAPITPRGTNKSRKQSLSLEEVFTHHLDLAVKNTGRESNVKQSTPYSQRVHSARESQEEEMEEAGPLHGVVIAVSKKLSTQQSEYNNIAAGLGADYRWTFDRSCTHFIFTGRLNDTNKEFRMAKDQGKVIVSPHWLNMCQEQKCRVDESLFPHTFNPNLSLTFSQAVTPASTRRSTRATRLTRKSKKSTDSSTSDTEAPKVKATKIAKASKKMFDSLDTTASDEEIAQIADNAEEEVKETNTQALVKDLKTLMAATKNYSSKSRRSSMKRNDSLGKLDDNEGSAKRSRLSSAHSRTDSTDTPGKRERRGSRSARSTPKAEIHSEVSQMAEVSWDDPIARLRKYYGNIGCICCFEIDKHRK